MLVGDGVGVGSASGSASAWASGQASASVSVSVWAWASGRAWVWVWASASGQASASGRAWASGGVGVGVGRWRLTGRGTGRRDEDDVHPVLAVVPALGREAAALAVGVDAAPARVHREQARGGVPPEVLGLQVAASRRQVGRDVALAGSELHGLVEVDGLPPAGSLAGELRRRQPGAVGRPDVPDVHPAVRPGLVEPDAHRRTVRRGAERRAQLHARSVGVDRRVGRSGVAPERHRAGRGDGRLQPVRGDTRRESGDHQGGEAATAIERRRGPRCNLRALGAPDAVLCRCMSAPFFGSPANPMGPAALRPRLPTGLPLSLEYPASELNRVQVRRTLTIVTPGSMTGQGRLADA